ncbi:transposase [Streptomyces beijiangensis]|uniref:Transposase n=1 Tax=Streptomyces beijiangensis TaxID=163361 RepID=A0A939F3Q4_9ACTN|nr:transposase [Streptomyces beijiangensis]
MDSQSIKATERGGWHGYDGGKEVLGFKRHLLVATIGLVLAVCVSPANVSDREGASVLLARCHAAPAGSNHRSAATRWQRPRSPTTPRRQLPTGHRHEVLFGQGR